MIAAALAAVLAAGANAQGPVVTVDEVPVAAVEAGGTGEAVLSITIAKGHRVQANPASSEFLVPLELRIEDGGGFLFGPVAYPDGEPYRLEGADEDLSTYAGTVEIVLPIAVDEAAEAGETRINAELHYQACNQRMCLFPNSIPVTVLVEVTTRSPDR